MSDIRPPYQWKTPPPDPEGGYECPSCTKAGLGLHPYSDPPCDPLPQGGDSLPSFDPPPPKPRSRHLVTIELDGVPGWGNSVDDHTQHIQTLLNQTIGHYAPSVDPIPDQIITSPKLVVDLLGVLGIDPTNDDPNGSLRFAVLISLIKAFTEYSRATLLTDEALREEIEEFLVG